MLDHLSHGSLADWVYEQLEDKILSGEMSADETLTELSLSKTMGVSRTPVREALRRLAQEGLIEMTVNKGYTVVGISPKDLSDIYAIRMKVEGLASRWAAQRITEDELKELENALELQEFYSDRQDAAHIKDLDSKFHDLIYQYADSTVLYQTLSNLHHRIKRFRQMGLSIDGRAEKTLMEHRAILDALRAHDPDAAEALTVDHLKNARDNLLTALSKNTEKR